MKLREQKW